MARAPTVIPLVRLFSTEEQQPEDVAVVGAWSARRCGAATWIPARTLDRGDLRDDGPAEWAQDDAGDDQGDQAQGDPGAGDDHRRDGNGQHLQPTQRDLAEARTLASRRSA